MQSVVAQTVKPNPANSDIFLKELSAGQFDGPIMREKRRFLPAVGNDTTCLRFDLPIPEVNGLRRPFPESAGGLAIGGIRPERAAILVLKLVATTQRQDLQDRVEKRVPKREAELLSPTLASRIQSPLGYGPSY